METPQCPQCRTPLPMHALGGLCPACMFEQGAFDSHSNIAGSAFIPPSIEELAPLFPSLEILELIGRGGMGAVYKARQTELDRVVALKILPAAIARDPAFSERFSREARALAKLNHPGIVSLFEFGRSGDLFFFLMEFVDGVTLRQLLLGERLSVREALAIVPRICDALQYAHDRGIVHRDIKPENILLDRQGNVKIADFGLVKLVDPSTSFEVPHPENSRSESRLKAEIPAYTEAGKLMGTPAYMAPEQIDHPSEVDHRADIYALGVIFYQMLTGELPDKPLAPPSSRTLIDVRLDEVVIRALQQNPSLRFQQADDLKTRIEEIAGSSSGHPPIKRRHSLIRILGILLILCLPLSVAICISTHVQAEKNLEEYTFTAPGQNSREAAAKIIKQALRPFPGVILSSQKENTTIYTSSSAKPTKQWRIGVEDADLNQARERLQQAGAAVFNALNEGNDDPLKEPVQLISSSSTQAGVRSWYGDAHFVNRTRWTIATGILLSAVGMLCVSVPRKPQFPPVSKAPGRISLGFLVAGLWGAFALLQYSGTVFGVQMALGIGVLAGVPAMIFGLSPRSGRLGRFVAAISWSGMLGLSLITFVPNYSGYFTSEWENVAIPAADGKAAPLLRENPRKNNSRAKAYAVKAWLEMIDSEKYAEAWERTSTLTRTLETQSEWIGKMKYLRNPFGETVDRKIDMIKETSELQGAPEGRYLILIYRTDFTAKSAALETVTLIYQDDGNWCVLGYSIE